ncbi:MAG: HEAT repeat domain-containing protein [Planctomycetota bacterium]|nr:HEAT repeat domain-containing protein [Planctomycetota bacterium]
MATHHQLGCRPPRQAAWAAMLSILLSGCGPTSSGPDPAAVERAQQDSLREAHRRQSDQHTLQSTSQDLDPATRQAAAAELLAQHSPEAMNILAEALTSGREPQVTAVLTAIESEIRPAPALRQAALDALATVPPVNRASLGGLLVRYAETSPDILDSIMNRSLDPEVPIAERESAVACLGELHSQPAEATGVLIELLQQSPPRPLADAAMNSLARLTGLPDKWDTKRWLAWWNANQDRPSTLWLRDAIQAQGRRITDLETQLRQARERDRLVVTRLVDVYRDLWPLLQIEQQLERIPDMLEDDRAGIRAFGVDRVAVLLRDGEANETIEETVLERLEDSDVEIRRKVASLLGELSNPDIMNHVTERLEIESDPEVLNHALRFLQIRGDRTDLGKVLPLLQDEETRDIASATTWSFLRSNAPTEEERLEVLKMLGDSSDESSTPSELALRVLVGPDSELVEADLLLRDPDSATRSAVAEALLRRKRYESVLANGSDSAIYPIAIQAALEMPTDRSLDRINRVLELSAPGESQQTLWLEAISKASESVPPVDQPLLDDRLAAHPAVDETLRITILDKALEQENLDKAEQIVILKRLVPLLIQENKAKTAVILLEKLHTEDPELSDMRFQAALLSRDFAIAANMHDDMPQWIEAYEIIQESHPESAGAVKDEITQRFNEQLDDALKTRLGIAVDPLMNDPGTTDDAPDEADDGPGK